tara:strand:+ start:102 stop:572 length:471 start_codon:yes stop_codon:yes gene_type:complete
MSFARGKFAFGYCDKTGFRYDLKDLVDEVNNGTKTGFRVGRDVVDPDHPQNFLGRVRIFDPQSLLNPRPERFTESVTIEFPTFDVTTLTRINVGFGVGRVGDIVTSGTASPVVNVSLTGVSGTGNLGTISISTGAGSTFDATNVTLDSTSKTFDEA